MERISNANHNTAEHTNQILQVLLENYWTCPARIDRRNGRVTYETPGGMIREYNGTGTNVDNYYNNSSDSSEEEEEEENRNEFLQVRDHRGIICRAFLREGVVFYYEPYNLDAKIYRGPTSENMRLNE